MNKRTPRTPISYYNLKPYTYNPTNPTHTPKPPKHKKNNTKQHNNTIPLVAEERRGMITQGKEGRQAGEAGQRQKDCFCRQRQKAKEGEGKPHSGPTPWLIRPPSI